MTHTTEPLGAFPVLWNPLLLLSVASTVRSQGTISLALCQSWQPALEHGDRPRDRLLPKNNWEEVRKKEEEGERRKGGKKRERGKRIGGRGKAISSFTSFLNSPPSEKTATQGG